LTEVYLLLGSNLNKPALQLNIALQHITEKAGELIVQSPVYRSSPWGVSDQPEFANQVILLQTSFSPFELLQCLQKIEHTMGRERIVKWGSRIIDIDILYYGKSIITNPALKVPHPELSNRRFTLVPLCAIAPAFIHPVWNVSNQTILQRCTDEGHVEEI